MKNTITLLFLISATTIFAQSTYVPDNNFEQALIDLGYDSGVLDDYVPTANINTVTLLNISNMDIEDLTGIEDFTALTGLNCHNNNLSSLNISTNTALTYLKCSYNNLSSLDVSANIALTDLICYHNNLTNLDISTNTALTSLKCQNNQLTALNLKNGNNTAIANADFNTTNNPNLTCILVDDATWSTTNWTNIDAQTHFVNNQAACDALAVDDTSFENSISVYPNPATDVINIDNNSNLTITNISIYDIVGKKVYEINKFQKIIHTGKLKAGFYLIKIKSDATSIIKKLMISK